MCRVIRKKMTTAGRQPYIGPAMSDKALSLYIKEVLGTETPRPVAVEDIAAVVVVTEELTEFSRNLLNKILASIGLTHWRHQTLNQPPIPARHRLLFSGQTPGRVEQGEKVSWNMPLLSEMLGDGPEVAQNKRVVWNLLQNFKRELG